MSKVFFLLVVATALATPLVAFGDNGATKQPMLSQSFGSCNSGPLGGNPMTGSWAILKRNGDGTISEEIHIVGAPANAQYFVDLVETPGGQNCVVADSNQILTTNKQGNGNIHVNIPESPGTTDAFAMLFPANAAAGPSGFITSPDVVFDP